MCLPLWSLNTDETHFISYVLQLAVESFVLDGCPYVGLRMLSAETCRSDVKASSFKLRRCGRGTVPRGDGAHGQVTLHPSSLI